MLVHWVSCGVGLKFNVGFLGLEGQGLGFRIFVKAGICIMLAHWV